MIFKSDWEKADQIHKISSDVIEQMVYQVLPNKKLVAQEVISGGCANINVKIRFDNEDKFFILRIYLRDKEAVYREQKLAILLKQDIPIPEVYYVGEYEDYRFAITKFIKGSTLRDLFVSNKPHDVETIMYDLGCILAKITKHNFPKAGFFDRNLSIVNNISTDGYLVFAKSCLKNQIVQTQLSSNLLSKIDMCLDKYSQFFPSENEKHLVHADFDPANILVEQVSDSWKITGVLDWEFSFSGSVLCDIANMLRYAHKMPSVFEKSFLLGLQNNGVSLPLHWRRSVHLLNILSLLDCLTKADSKDRPNQVKDIRSLLTYITKQLDQ